MSLIMVSMPLDIYMELKEAWKKFKKDLYSMDKSFIKDKKKKKNIFIRFMEWIIRGQKKAVEKGDFCRS
ncbi:MAG: hypothetical protein DRH26_01540 [Deltaproteobacteria bacterium]|nr:MAG: hypothetical protein DRH26_01540 [Deltaproteobacteria bacterium]